MELSERAVRQIKDWLKLSEPHAEWTCPFGETHYMRNVGPAEAGKICAEIFPEILPKIAPQKVLHRKICCHVCPCNLLGYDEVARRAQKFVDAH